MLTEKLLRLVIIGGSEWVMVLLILLSIASVAVMVERALFYHKRRLRLDRLDRELSALIASESNDRIAKMKQLLAREDEPALRAAISGHGNPGKDRGAVEKLVSGALERDRLELERRLSFLGTLGNNAPFIGLFGTVLGIMRAFHDLAMAGRPNTSVVMAGISEALVATAIGLFVALPAVLFYNYFQRNVDRTLSITEALAQGIISTLPAAPSVKGPEPARTEAG